MYPKSEEYRAAFQHVQDTLTDETLKKGIVKKNALGPQVLSGNFAYAYEITLQNRVKYAVRCFRYDSRGRKERYKAISNYIKKLKSHYFVDFEYQDEGIIINGAKFPIVKMAWAEGELLGDFIKNNHSNRFRIKNLLNSIRKLAKFIEKNNFAHGDIQTGNIIVSDEGRVLKLIDYDGMYVEELRNFGNVECGVPNFQHPKRNDNWSKKLDRFSFIAIYVALSALMDRHYLWDETDSDTEAILFRGEDYANPKNSRIFKKLYSLETTKKYITSFENICEGQFKNIPSLESFIKNNTSKVRTSVFVPIITIIAVFCFVAYSYYTKSDIWQSIIEGFWSNEIQSSGPIESKGEYLYDIKNYDNVINTLSVEYSVNPDNINNTLSLIMAYGMSGFDDNVLSSLSLPLENVEVKDERLFFALAALNWRKGDLSKAKAYIDELKQVLSQNSNIKEIVSLFDNLVQKEIDSYNLYYNAISLEVNARAEFAAAMVLWDRARLYKIMEEMYKQSFIGFSARHKFNPRLSFREWFDIYSGYNAAMSMQRINSLYSRYRTNNYLAYQLAVNIANLYLEGRFGCVSNSKVYEYTLLMLGNSSDILNVNQALKHASKLPNTSFSKAYGYYALGLAYYANNDFENAKKSFKNAKNYAQMNLGDSIDNYLNNIDTTIACENVMADFQNR
jgi:tRNA A-37 threonylcarbamoyl transferase component Bud32